MNVTECSINREDHVQTKGNTWVQFFLELRNVQAWLASFMRALETDERSKSVHSAPSRLDAVGQGDRHIHSRANLSLLGLVVPRIFRVVLTAHQSVRRTRHAPSSLRCRDNDDIVTPSAFTVIIEVFFV